MVWVRPGVTPYNLLMESVQVTVMTVLPVFVTVTLPVLSAEPAEAV